MQTTREELEEELERFVTFGAVLDATTRKYLVQYLRKKLFPMAPEPDALNSQYAEYFQQALDELFGDDLLVQVCHENDLLATQVMRDTLNWFRKTYQRIAAQNPHADEQQELESWAVRHLRQFTRSWSFFVRKVEGYYPKEELDPSFHRDRFKSLIRERAYEEISGEDREAIERVFNDLLGQWDARLQAKILRYQLSKLGESQASFREVLEGKARQYEQLTRMLSPFTEYVGRYWDMSRALWQDTTFDVLDRYHELLEQEDSLQRLVDILGKMRQAAIETDEDRYERVVVTGKWVRDPNQRSEIVGVREDDDLNNLVSSEVGLLGDSATETLFLKKFADKGLLTHAFEDKRLEHSSEILYESQQRVKRKKKGPFIVCVDTSGSMEGEPEHIAKVLCFAILRMAAEEERQAYLINFSTGIQTIDLYDLRKSVDAVAQFLQMSFRGGTDISLALNEALEQLEGNTYKDADVLVISDFIMYALSPDLASRMQHQQDQAGTQFHSLIITDQPNEEVIEKFDHVWLYNPDQKGVIKQLYTDVRGVMDRAI